ncbi:MAG: histidine phosphatase family protein [Sandaracinaceae bacterium]|nr:histidine phosphatase family protein [Sandaracinaceae bacterium]
MCGLPARGKTHIALRISRYLSWLGYRTRHFNVGTYRRTRLGSQKRHEFFDPRNPEAREARRDVAMAALSDLCDWFREGGEVGIYDATNSVRSRRDAVRARCENEGLAVVFIESICEDEALVAANIRQTKLHMPDYAGMDPDAAVADFRARIAHYASVYEPVAKDEGAYIKLIDAGRELLAHQIQGYVPSRLVSFLMNLHLVPRSIYMTRHGQSEFNKQRKIGGDSPLSPQGEEFSARLRDYMIAEVPSNELMVWTSTLQRTIHTAARIERPTTEWRELDEIDAGECDGMTYEEIQTRMPREFTARTEDKFGYRYPRGESYRDILRRLDRVIVEVERERSPVLIVGHQAVLRALYAYFMDKPTRDCPFLEIPLHTVFKLTPTPYGCDEERIVLGPIIAKGESVTLP